MAKEKSSPTEEATPCLFAPPSVGFRSHLLVLIGTRPMRHSMASSGGSLGIPPRGLDKRAHLSEQQQVAGNTQPASQGSARSFLYGRRTLVWLEQIKTRT